MNAARTTVFDREVQPESGRHIGSFNAKFYARGHYTKL